MLNLTAVNTLRFTPPYLFNLLIKLLICLGSVFQSKAVNGNRIQSLSRYSAGPLRATGVSIGCCMADDTIHSCTLCPSAPVGCS
jgi:hypothetical protein